MNACLGTFGGLEPQAKEAFSSQPTPRGWMKAPKGFIVPATRGNSMICYDHYRTLCASETTTSIKFIIYHTIS